MGTYQRLFTMNDFACTFVPFNECLGIIEEAGRGCFLAKMDWSGAYKQIVVRKEQFELCGFEFGGKFSADIRLPFGATNCWNTVKMS
jgi:hypothetical protein